MLILRRPWTEQPQDAEPTLGRFKAVWTGAQSAQTLVANQLTQVTNPADAPMVPTQRGMAVSFATSAATRIQLASSADSVLGFGSNTFAILRRCKDTTNRNSTVFGYENSGTDIVQLVAPFTDGNLYFDYGSAVSGRINVAYTKDTEWETLVLVAGPIKGREIWRRGIRLAANTGTNYARVSTSTAFSLGSRSGSTNNADNEEIALFVSAPYEWTDAEIRDWCNDPFGQTFAPRQIWIPATAAASFNPTLSLPTYVPGSLTSSAFRPRVTATWS